MTKTMELYPRWTSPLASLKNTFKSKIYLFDGLDNESLRKFNENDGG
jgi:hypothetical protein